jgi:hypothetical protein
VFNLSAKTIKYKYIRGAVNKLQVILRIYMILGAEWRLWYVFADVEKVCIERWSKPKILPLALTIVVAEDLNGNPGWPSHCPVPRPEWYR